MTTIAEAREELADALTAGGLTVSPALGRFLPPCAVIFGGGYDPTVMMIGQVSAGFRVMLEAGAADQAATASELDEMAALAVQVIRSLPGWRLGLVSPVTIRKPGLVEYLTADVNASRLVTLPTLPVEEP